MKIFLFPERVLGLRGQVMKYDIWNIIFLLLWRIPGLRGRVIKAV